MRCLPGRVGIQVCGAKIQLPRLASGLHADRVCRQGSEAADEEGEEGQVDGCSPRARLAGGTARGPEIEGVSAARLPARSAIERSALRSRSRRTSLLGLRHTPPRKVTQPARRHRGV
ncbi:hypothetical protein MRX96_038712 [Rhipicephalus microplus]